LNLFGKEPPNSERNKKVQAVVEQNQGRLNSLCQMFFDSITASLPRIPIGIRCIAKYLVVRGEEVYRELSDREKNLLIGSFFFLRYITPAIISPEVYGILDDVQISLSDSHRRTLVLIAKVLQNLANDHIFNGKEAFMESMNLFLKESAPSLTNFFLSLVDVADPKEYLENANNSSPLGLGVNSNDNMESTSTNNNLLSFSSMPSSISSRAIITTPYELFLLVNLLKENALSVLFGNDDALTQVIDKIQSAIDTSLSISPNTRKPPIDIYRPLLLRVPLTNDLLKVNSSNPASTTNEEEQTILNSVKMQFAKLFGSMNVDFDKFESQLLKNLERTLSVCNKENESEATIKILSALINEQLVQLSGDYQENNWKLLMDELEKDLLKKELYYERLLSDRMEMVLALNQHQKEIINLHKEEDVFSKYLENAKSLANNENFRKWKEKNRKRNGSLLASSPFAIVDEESGEIKLFREKVSNVSSTETTSSETTTTTTTAATSATLDTTSEISNPVNSNVTSDSKNSGSSS